MGALLISLIATLASTLRTRTSLQVEILALRRQLAVLKRTKRRRVPLRAMDRLLQAFPWDTAPRYLLHDRDRIYGDAFPVQAANMAVTSVLTVPQSPWQSQYMERPIGSFVEDNKRAIVWTNAT